MKAIESHLVDSTEFNESKTEKAKKVRTNYHIIQQSLSSYEKPLPRFRTSLKVSYRSVQIEEKTREAIKIRFSGKKSPEAMRRRILFEGAEIKGEFEEKLDSIHQAIKVMETNMADDHKKIFDGISSIYGEILSSRALLLNAINKYPHQVIKLFMVFLGLFSGFSLVLGKILNRVIIAPDYGLVLVIISFVLYGTVQLSLNKIRKEKE